MKRKDDKRTHNALQARLRRASARRPSPSRKRSGGFCEPLERRDLLSASAFLQGTVADINNTPLAGAVVTLYPHGSSTAIGSVTTGADGKYLFTTDSVPSLVPGAEYDLVETPPAGYANSTTSGFTQLSTIVGQTDNSFDINIPSPAAASVNVQPTLGPGGFFNNYDVLTWTYNGMSNPGGSDGDAVEQFPATVNGHSYMSLCTDPAGVLQYGTDAFSVLPTTAFPAVDPSYSGRIGYLYNKYGTQTLNAQQAVGLQLAIWTLLSDAGGNLDNGNFVPADFASSTSTLTTQKFIDIAQVPGFSGAGYTTATFLQEEQQAADYLNESHGKSDAAWFLKVDGSSPITLGSQSLIATDNFNFTNLFAPSITTTPSAAGTPGNSTITGAKFLDLTGNGFSADDTGLGGVAINLYQESNSATGLQTGSGGDTLVGTTTTASDGTYSFPNPGAGTYYVQEAVPSGYIQTGGGPSGLAGNSYYKIVVAADTSYAGYDFDDYKIPTCAPTCVTYTVTHNGCSTTVTDLTGQTHPGDTVTVHFTVPAGMNDELTLVSYYAPQSYWSDSNAYQQLIYQQDTGVFAPGQHSLTVQIPNSYYQIDFICGKAIDQLEPNQNGNAYGPDSSNILYHAQNRYLDSDNGGSSAPSTLNTSSPSVPAPTSTPSPSTYKLNDSATLSGGYNPAGTVTFYLFAPGVTPNSDNSNAIYTDTVTVNGNGVYNTGAGDHPGGFAATVKGTYQWVAVYSGDGSNISVTSPFGSEPFTIAKASPTITTTPQQTSASCVSPGEFATIGFWHNCNGQAVIESFNGSATSTALGNWMAANWPNLFGAASPYLSSSLAGKTNAQIAAAYLNLWTPSGCTKNTYVQAFAVALGLYADTTSLGGQSLLDNGLAAKYGFVVTAGGAGTFNIGGNGAAFGVSNDSVLSVQQILSDVDAAFNPATGAFYVGDQTVTSAANNVLNGINTEGDIPGGTVIVGSGIDLTDSATLSGGDNPTGTITFTLYGPDGTTVVDTETVDVNGNGTYYTPNGYLATATGTYQWVASYSGDANNDPVSGNFGDEPVMVGVTSLSLTTTPGATVILGSGNKLSDSATLSGGFNPGGTIVFTLYDPNDVAVYTDAVTVNGNGTYTTSTGTNPGGYLPSMLGTYQWVASYSGDANNSPEVSNKGDEPESVVSSICISGTKFLDLTGNGFSSDDQGLGGVTIKLFKDADSDGKLTSADGASVATTLTASGGAYQFTNLTPGTYFVQESVPARYIQTGGGPNGAAGATYYKVVAAAGSTYSGNNFDDAEKCDLSKVTCVSYAINGCKPVSTLSGNTHQGDTVKVTFTYTGSGPHDFTLVSYTAPGSTFDASTAYLQLIYQESSITVNGPGTYSLTVKIPNCYYQIDFVCGDAIDQLGPTDAGPDQSNIFYTPQSRLIGADNGGTQSCSTVCKGDFATVDFWKNRNGQNLIKCLNGGPNSTDLAKWLVTSFPNLYGKNAGSTCLVNKDGSYFTNKQIANAYLGSAFYGAGSTGKSRWGWGGWAGGWSQAGDQTNAQILSAALSEYVTNVELAGGNMAAKYGFNTSQTGTGCDAFNVGSNGAAFGVPNYTNCSVHQLLCYVNSHCSNGSLYSGDSSLKNHADSCFSSINSGGNISMLATGSDIAASSDSQLALTPAMLESGQIWVTIDGLDPLLGAQQEAAFDAGIASLNAQLGQYGVTLVDVTANPDAAAMADINVHLCDTSAIGGVSDGVLGLTLLGGNVTLVNGWNWYYGADATQIGASQYDFQTVATHELGHAIGLGHSTDANSVMYPYLSAGEVHRALTAADLSIIDTESGSTPEPLLAGGGLSAASEAAIGALFGSGASPVALSPNSSYLLTAPANGWGANSGSPWSGIASSLNRRLSFRDYFSSDDGIGEDLAAHAADAADDLYQAAVDAVHSIFG